MTILITGASGFIGSALSQHLEKAGHSIIRLGRKDGNISNPEVLAKMDDMKIEHVFHLAASGIIPESWEVIPEYLESIVVGSSRVFEACKRWKASYTYLSSYMYGMPEYLPIDEEHRNAAKNPYALSKKLSEEVCRFYSQELGVQGIIIRPFVVFGPGQKNTFLIPMLIQQALENDEIVVNDLTPKKRDYLYIEDLVNLLEKTIHTTHHGEAYNAAMGVSYTVSELVSIIQSCVGSSKPLRSRGIERKNDYPNVVASIEKAKREFNWEPKFSMEQAIKAYLNAIKIS